MADDVVQKAGGAEKAKEHLAKAGDAANRATGGKYERHVDKAEEAARSALDKQAKKKNKPK
ncbi:MAG TPA: Rv0909 family putative TA system antitoxin [Natronosporangium sp.]